MGFHDIPNFECLNNPQVFGNEKGQLFPMLVSYETLYAMRFNLLSLFYKSNKYHYHLIKYLVTLFSIGTSLETLFNDQVSKRSENSPVESCLKATTRSPSLLAEAFQLSNLH